GHVCVCDYLHADRVLPTRAGLQNVLALADAERLQPDGWTMSFSGNPHMEKTPETKPGLSRRTFIGAAWAFSLVALFGQAGAALLEYLKPRVTEGGFGGKVNAGRPKEFKVGTVSLVQKGHFYMSRLEDGNYLAIWQRCTHLGCTVPWRS